MTLLENLTATSRRVSDTASRLAKRRELADYVRGLADDEIPIAIAFLSGETRQGKLGVSYATLHGAGGHAAATPSLTLHEVDDAFAELLTIKGSGSSERRAERLSALFARATHDEQDFLARLIVGELRQGALAALVLEAIASAADIPVAELRKAAMSAGGIGEVAQVALTQGGAALGRFSIRLMQPVLPMLSQSAPDTETALKNLGTAALEWKLDGARVQVHKRADDVRIYSRTGNDVTPAAPEIVELARAIPAASAIIDGEAIVLNASGAPYPFQETMSRFGRAQDIEAMRARMPLSAFFFDCLRRDDEDLVALPAQARYEALAHLLPASNITPRIVTSVVGEAREFYEDATSRGHEGVMVKAIDAAYDPGSRSAAWLKVKRSHTLDLVVLAAEWGHGRRRGWLSNLHLGALDPATGEYVMLGKTFKGMTDAILAWQTEELQKREIARDDWTVYVRPELVVEVTFNDLQQSSRYPGGLALRFARIKGYRPDKRAVDADTMETVRAIFAAQAAST